MLESKNYPDFLIVGAAKSGTTSLYKHLQNHPNIFMSEKLKELNFLHFYRNEKQRKILEYSKKNNNKLPLTIDEYLEIFKNKKHNQICGECSPSYMIYYEDTIRNIQQLFPNPREIKIIILLREPIDKIWSHYKFVRTLKLDPDFLTLEDSLDQEEKKHRTMGKKFLPDLFYIYNTSYLEQVRAYKENFNHVKIVLFEELVKNTSSTIKEIEKFLNVPSNNKLEFKKHNESELFLQVHRKKNIYNNIVFLLPKKLRQTIINKLNKKTFEFVSKRIHHKKPEMLLSTKKRLAFLFLKQITELNYIIENDLSHWITKHKKIIEK